MDKKVKEYIEAIYNNYKKKAKEVKLKGKITLEDIYDIISQVYESFIAFNIKYVIINLFNEDKLYLYIELKTDKLIVNIWNKEEKDNLIICHQHNNQ